MKLQLAKVADVNNSHYETLTRGSSRTCSLVQMLTACHSIKGCSHVNFEQILTLFLITMSYSQHNGGRLKVKLEVSNVSYNVTTTTKTAATIFSVQRSIVHTILS